MRVNLPADGIRSSLLDTGRISLSLREAGRGAPAIFLHGITSTAAVWDPLLLALREEAHGIAADQRGHGHSDKPDRGYAAEDYAHDIVALIEALRAGPAILVGHSLGARNSIVAASLRPDLVRAVVAIDFTPFIEPAVFDALEARVTAGDRVFHSRDDIAAYLQDRYPLMPPDAIGRRAMSAYAEAEGVFRPLASPAAMVETAGGLRADLAPALEALRVPTIIVRGALSRLVSPDAFERTKRLRPDLPTLVVDGADHYVNEEAPGPIIAAIRSASREPAFS